MTKGKKSQKYESSESDDSYEMPVETNKGSKKPNAYIRFYKQWQIDNKSRIEGMPVSERAKLATKEYKAQK